MNRRVQYPTNFLVNEASGFHTPEDSLFHQAHNKALKLADGAFSLFNSFYSLTLPATAGNAHTFDLCGATLSTLGGYITFVGAAGSIFNRRRALFW